MGKLKIKGSGSSTKRSYLAITTNEFIQNIFYKFVQLIFLFIISLFSSSAYAASLGFTITQTQTGGLVGPFNTVGDDYCATASTPGCDFSNTDSIVRTNDDIEFEFNLSVGPAGDDPIVVTAELDPGLIWPTLPSSCNPFTSSITGDGTAGNPSIMNCDLGARAAFATTFNVAARAMGSNLNGTTAGLANASIDAPNSTKLDVANLPPDVKITASPRMNLQKKIYNSTPVTISGEIHLRVLYQWWIDTWKHDTNGNTSDDPDPSLGNEMIVGPVTFTEDPSTVSPNAYIESCYTSDSTLFPYKVYNATYPERSVTNAGNSACANTGPTATGPTTVTVTGADYSLTHTPTQRNGGAAISSDRKIASFGFIRILVPVSDIDDAGGSLASVNTITDFDPVSISGASNLDEDESDNTTARTLVAGKGSWSKLFRHSMRNEQEPGRGWSNPPTTATGNWAGDGVVQPGQYFATSSGYNNNSFGPVDEVEICDVIDTNLYEFADVNATPGSAHTVYGDPGMATGGEGVGYVVEYGINYVGTWPPASYPNPASLNSECTDASVQWFSSLTAARAAGTPTKVRYRRLTPQPIGSGGLVLKHRAKQILTAPNGTLLTNMATYRSSLNGMEWRDCAYNAGGWPTPTQVSNGCGDRLALTRAVARVEKTTLPGDLIDVVQSGGTVRYKIASTYTSINAVSDNITIVDNLPAGVSYAPNSAIWNNIPREPVVTGTPATGQTLTWNLGVLAANAAIPDIEFDINVPITANNGTHLDNSVTIEAPLTDGSSDAQRSDERRVTVSSPASLILAKKTTTPLEETDTPLSFVVEYFNGTNDDIPRTDVIDILPYVGDGRNPASSFSGTYSIAPLTFDSSNGIAYYTNRASASVNNDPQDSSNAIPSGATKWCTAAQFNTAGCPTGFNNITAIRLVDNAILVSKTSRTFTIDLTPAGNYGGEIYTNIAQGSGQGVTLSAFSPFATSRIIEEPALGLAKALSSQSGSNLTYSFVLENLGNTVFSNLTLIDDFDTTFGAGNYTIATPPAVTVQPNGGNLTANAGYTGSGANTNLLDPAGVNNLIPGTTATVTVTVNLHNLTDQGSGIGVYNNSATTEGTTPNGSRISDTSDNGTDPDANNDGDASDANENDPTPITFTLTPSWTLDKATTSVPTSANDVMVYTFSVENTGNVSISAVTLTDNQCDAAPVLSSGDLNNNTLIDETETWSYTCNHTVTQAEVDAGTVDNTATVKGTPNAGTLADATDTENVPVVADPSLSVVKSAPTHTDTDGDGDVTLGDTLTYTITATNDGNITLNNVVVSDVQVTPASETCATVLPAATCVLTGSHLVTQADVDAAEVVNTAQVISDEITTPVPSEEIVTPITKIILATPEIFPPVNGADGGVTSSVLASDTLNGTAVDPADVTITVGASDPGLTLDPATGLITVAPGTAAGDHTVTYTICENADPTNCSTTTETVTVEAPEILATPETFPPVNGADGGVTSSVLASDTLNGVAVVPTDVTISVGTSDPELTLDPATGLITVASGTPAGDYTVTYTICEKLNPTNCSTTTETVTVEAPEILATPETFPPVNGADGGVTSSVLASDTLNGVAVVPADVTIAVGTSDPELTLDPASGLITVAPGTPAGDYTVAYTICEKLNPTNCSTTTETVTVEAPEILATPETFPPVVGSAGGVTSSVLASDTLNGEAVVPADVTISVGASDPALTLDPATGLITVAPGTPAGDYTVTYTICENLNSTNCSTTTETVTVEAAEILATPETFPPVNGLDGGVTSSVLASDTLNGVAVVPTDVTITVGASDPELTLDPATGLITVAPGTQAGDYTVTYTICENLNPTNCSTTTETVTVEPAEILATPETFSPINSLDGGVTSSVLASDTLNGEAVVAADVTITVGASDPELTLDPVTGLITVAPGTPAGTYTVAYTICENLNPTNCSTTTETVVVEPAEILAIPESFPAFNGLDGGVTTTVLASDTLNGVAVVPADVTITVDSSDPALTLDPVTGLITIAPGTPAGQHTVTYTICENLNPTNCSTTTETVAVDVAPIAAIPESYPAINGLDGGVTTSVLASDTLNQVSVDPADVTITVGASDSELTLDPVTGLITVAPNTAAGTYTVTYTICENLNPTNCATTIETVVVEAADILAVPETFPPVNGYDGGITTSVLASDTLNGVAVVPADVTINVGASDPGLTLDPATGLITVAPGTPAGDHTVTYTICENLNPTNCSTTTETVTVEAPAILATPETFSPVNGTGGGVTTSSVLASDTLNGVAVVPAEVTITVGASDPALTLDPVTGLITVAPGTPAGDYTVSYTICENLNPTNCSTTTEVVTVETGEILATPETFPAVNGADGGVTTSVLASDILDGEAVVPTDVTITVGASDPELTLDPATGLITVSPGTPAGDYSVTYTICENLNPTNCSTTTETVTVEAPVILATPETFPPVSGLDGGVTSSVLDSDTLNGVAVDPADVTITVGASDPALTLDPATGLITVAPGTAAGNYTVTYTICEKLNPTNCSTTTETVTVESAEILAAPEAFPAVNGADGGVTTSVLTSDVISGVPVVPADVTITVGTSDPELTLDPVTGLITVAPGTPAGDYTVTYTVCENLNPTNCDTTTETVKVEAPVILATPETFPPVNGSSGGVTSSVLSNDTLNGVAVAPADVTITVGASSPGLALDPVTGLITVAPGTPAGDFTVTYTICEKLNPNNCSTTTETVTVEVSEILATPETFPAVNGLNGGVTGSVLATDTLDGVEVAPADVTITVGDSAPGLTLDPVTGLITVAPSTPAGDHTVTYTICEKLNPSNCSTATETVTVEAAEILATPETFPSVNGTNGGVTTSVLASDTLNGVAVDPADITITVGASASGLTLDPSTGLITVAPGTPAGDYTVTYTICEKLNPSNCSTTTETVTVVAAVIVAVPETFSPVNGIDGGATTSVLASDTINGVAVVPADVTITVDASTPGVTLNPDTGLIIVAPGTPVGDYTVTYTICENLNPTNCSQTTETVSVEAPTYNMIKTSDTATISAPGTITYTFTFTNNGNISLANLDIMDPNAVVAGCPIATLAVGESASCTGTREISQAQIDAGAALPNTAIPSVTGSDGKTPATEDNDGDLATPNDLADNTTTTTVTQNPELRSSKFAGTPILNSDLTFNVPFTILVKNTGNVSLNALSLEDNMSLSDQLGSTFINIVGVPSVAISNNISGTAIAPTANIGFDGRSSDPKLVIGTDGLLAPEDEYVVNFVARINPRAADAPEVLKNQSTTGAASPSGARMTDLSDSGSSAGQNASPDGSSDTDIATLLDWSMLRIPNAELLISKAAAKKEAAAGDLIPYTVLVKNKSTFMAEGVNLVDDLPNGFKMVKESIKIKTYSAEHVLESTRAGVGTGIDPVSILGLTVPVETEGYVKVTYLVKVGTTASAQKSCNTVEAAGKATSNTATACVLIKQSSVLDQSTLIGKVFHDRDGDGFQDSANITGITVKSDYFGWNSLDLGGLNGRVSVLDDPAKHRKVIRMPYTRKNDFKVITQQGTVIKVDHNGEITTAHKGMKRRGLTAQDLRITTRRIRGIQTQTPVEANQLSNDERDVLEITLTNHGIHEEGIPGVRLASVAGLLIETDGYGRYHLPEVNGGRRSMGQNMILKVDVSTLPRGARFTTENPRVLRVTGAALNKINFGVQLPVKQQQKPLTQSSTPVQTLTQPSVEDAANAALKRALNKIKFDVPVQMMVEVDLKDDFFVANSADVQVNNLAVLDQIAERVKQHGSGHIRVMSADNDAGLAKLRANSVRRALHGKLGNLMGYVMVENQ